MDLPFLRAMDDALVNRSKETECFYDKMCVLWQSTSFISSSMLSSRGNKTLTIVGDKVFAYSKVFSDYLLLVSNPLGFQCSNTFGVSI